MVALNSYGLERKLGQACYNELTTAFAADRENPVRWGTANPFHKRAKDFTKFVLQAAWHECLFFPPSVLKETREQHNARAPMLLRPLHDGTGDGLHCAYSAPLLSARRTQSGVLCQPIVQLAENRTADQAV